MKVYRQYPEQNGNTAYAPTSGDKLARTAMYIACLSVFTMLLSPVLIPYIPAAIAITMAVISRGKSDKMSKRARAAFIIGLTAIVVSTAILAVMIVTLIDILHDPARLQEFNNLMYQMYGITLEEFLEQYGLHTFTGVI